METETSYDTLFENRRAEYLKETRELFSAFMQQPSRVKPDLFLSFTQWEGGQPKDKAPFSLADHKLLFGPTQIDEEKGGYYLRVAGKGIAISPGKTFFASLFQQGFTLFDIDLIIAPHPSAEMGAILKEIHALNRELNRTLLSYEQEAHVIRFLLHPELYSELSRELRPEFREERHSLHSLETFAQNDGEESYEISQDLHLAYTKAQNDALALRLQTKNFSLGLLSGTGWHERLKPFFASCRFMLCGIGQTPAEDLEQVSLQTDALGLFGLAQLLESLPGLDLVLLSEFSRQDGDIRLELVKKIRQMAAKGPAILPVAFGFRLQLESGDVVTANNQHIHYQEVKVVRAEGSFGTLLYVSNENIV